MVSLMIGALVLGLVPADSQNARIGTVRGVTTTSSADGTVAFRVTGDNPCGAVHVIYGDGEAITHPTVSLPVTITYPYPRSGRFDVTVQGMGNCAGQVTTRIDVTVPPDVARARSRPASTPADVAGNGQGRGRGRGADQRATRRNTQDMRFAGMDDNGDGIVSRNEWRGSPTSFLVHDWNNDGRLSGDEVRPGAVRPSAYRNRQDDVVPAWSRQTFDEHDRDRNGRISILEWPYAPEIFRRVDRNGDRFVTMTEFTTAEMDDDRDDLFEDLDLNADGYLSGTEWHGSDATFEWLDQDRDRRLSRAEVVGDDRTSLPALQQRIRVPGDVKWVDTGIVVQAGDELAIRATGEVLWTGRSTERADPSGSLSGGFTAGAPLPDVRAGALIARVDRFTPFPAANGYGRIRVVESGRLYLGINDDNVSDNRGSFDVQLEVYSPNGGDRARTRRAR